MSQKGTQLPRALLFRDSFFTGVAPYLAEHMEHSAFYWQRWTADTPIVQMLAEHRPDLVVEEVVERALGLASRDFPEGAPQFLSAALKQ